MAIQLDATGAAVPMNSPTTPVQKQPTPTSPTTNAVPATYVQQDIKAQPIPQGVNIALNSKTGEAIANPFFRAQGLTPFNLTSTTPFGALPSVMQSPTPLGPPAPVQPPAGLSVAAKVDPNEAQRRMQALLADGKTDLDNAGDVREKVNEISKTETTITETATGASGAGYGLEDISKADVPDEVKSAYDDDIKESLALQKQAQADMTKAQTRLTELLTTFSSDPNAQKLAAINVALGKSEEDIRKSLQEAGVPASVALVTQMVHEHDKTLISERNYLTALAEQRDKMFDRMKDVNIELAEQTAKSFDRQFGITESLIALKEKEGDRADKLRETAIRNASDRAKSIVSTGAIAYMSEAELAKMAKESGYPIEALIAAKKSAQKKEANADRALDNTANRLALDAGKVTGIASTKFTLGDTYENVDSLLAGSVDASPESDGFVNTATYAAARSKAKDTDDFDLTFGGRLNPNDPTAKGFISNFKKLTKAGDTPRSTSVNYTNVSIPDDIDQDLRANIQAQLDAGVTWEEVNNELANSFPEVGFEYIASTWQKLSNNYGSF